MGRLHLTPVVLVGMFGLTPPAARKRRLGRLSPRPAIAMPI